MRNVVFSLLLLCVALFSQPVMAGDTPDMTGTWVCESTIVASIERGIYENPKADSTFVIEKQKGRVFAGYKQWTAGGKTYTEDIVGGIAADGELYIAEAKDGHTLGDLAADGKSFIVFYVENGPQGKMVELTYVKK